MAIRYTGGLAIDVTEDLSFAYNFRRMDYIDLRHIFQPKAGL
jgi:hypothetical protein